jgi:hypothetical protein
MRYAHGCLVVLLALSGLNALAAERNYPVQNRIAVMEDGVLRHENRRQPYGFRLEVMNDNEGVKLESAKDGRPFVTAHQGERYTIRLYNPLPVRVAVNLTVDGLNSISGKPSGISDGDKWMIEPYSYVTVPGWQVSGAESRRFFFTDKPKSYAQWRGEMLGKDLAANCGVVGAAYFWNQEELDRYYDDHPVYRNTRHTRPYRSRMDKSAGGFANAPACSQRANFDGKSEETEDQAGTGMGERESHPTVQVAFNYDAGMYNLSQALVVYYGFEEAKGPNPFPALDYAPEMN